MRVSERAGEPVNVAIKEKGDTVSENVGRCRAAIGLLEAARELVEKASTEAGGALWTNNLRDARAVVRTIERMQQRLVLKHDAEKARSSTYRTKETP